MAKFQVVIMRTQTHTTSFTISAKDEDSANDKALAQVEKQPSSFEWDLDDDTFEVQEISEDGE
jgi:hypothetical protein